MAKRYRDLIVWQKAMLLTEASYSVANALPVIERFGLSAQLRRASVSIPSNIAEGHERRSRAEYRRFISIACGSLAELETQLDLASRLHAVEKELTAHANGLADEVGRLLRSIERSLRNSKIIGEPSRSALPPSALGPQPFE